MPKSRGLSHIAMSVPEGTLTEGFREEVIAFYGEHFGWREIESLRLPDRLTIAVGGGNYVNLRERADSMLCHGYEHFGLVMRSSEDVEDAWNALDGDGRAMELEPLSRGDDGYRAFRVQYLMPLVVEVQFIPEG